MDLTVDGYKRALVKEGNPPEDEIQKAEYNLRIQYADAIGDHEYRMYCNAVKEISRIEITLAQIATMIQALKEAYVPLFARELNKLLQSNIFFNAEKPEEYNKALDRAANRSKGIKLTLDLKRIAAKKLEAKYTGENGGLITREYYMGILIELSDAAGYPLHENITVWEFCERIKKMNKRNEQANNIETAKKRK